MRARNCSNSLCVTQQKYILPYSEFITSLVSNVQSAANGSISKVHCWNIWEFIPKPPESVANQVQTRLILALQFHQNTIRQRKYRLLISAAKMPHLWSRAFRQKKSEGSYCEYSFIRLYLLRCSTNACHQIITERCPYGTPLQMYCLSESVSPSSFVFTSFKESRKAVEGACGCRYEKIESKHFKRAKYKYYNFLNWVPCWVS